MEILLFLILIVLIAGFFPGLLSNIGSVIGTILFIAIISAAWGWTGFAIIIGIPLVLVIIGFLIPDPDPDAQKQSADDIIQRIREREEGPEGNVYD